MCVCVFLFHVYYIIMYIIWVDAPGTYWSIEILKHPNGNSLRFDVSCARCIYIRLCLHRVPILFVSFIYYLSLRAGPSINILVVRIWCQSSLRPGPWNQINRNFFPPLSMFLHFRFPCTYRLCNVHVLLMVFHEIWQGFRIFSNIFLEQNSNTKFNTTVTDRHTERYSVLTSCPAFEAFTSIDVKRLQQFVW